ncbi:MAG: acyltransferase [Methylothermaceae bacteria B42]|nr:MAG: acyltransferase [Methylothermaceae bacteria B42]HHJ40336.1 carbon-nitrogen hydrolase family protein [Methylothermaceae bacterium]
MNEFIAAAIQMTSSDDLADNLRTANRLICEAANKGAKLVLLPENFAFMGREDHDKLALAEPDGLGPIQTFLADCARHHQLWLVGGSVPLQSHNPEKIRAACLIYDTQGRRVARYDKVHLFDVDVPGSDESYRESDTIEAGDRPVLLNTPFGKLGLTICYDLRFPEYIRLLAKKGLEILLVPAAFTARTGAAHWEVLLRARAIENQCYVIAANQGGIHANGRETYGHSMIIDPWGKVLARLAQTPGVCTANIDLQHLERVRNTFPALQHCRF